jgi:hypothetical protein
METAGSNGGFRKIQLGVFEERLLFAGQLGDIDGCVALRAVSSGGVHSPQHYSIFTRVGSSPMLICQTRDILHCSMQKWRLSSESGHDPLPQILAGLKHPCGVTFRHKTPRPVARLCGF